MLLSSFTILTYCELLINIDLTTSYYNYLSWVYNDFPVRKSKIVRIVAYFMNFPTRNRYAGEQVFLF